MGYLWLEFWTRLESYHAKFQILLMLKLQTSLAMEEKPIPLLHTPHPTLLPTCSDKNRHFTDLLCHELDILMFYPFYRCIECISCIVHCYWSISVTSLYWWGDVNYWLSLDFNGLHSVACTMPLNPYLTHYSLVMGALYWGRGGLAKRG